MIKNLLDLKLLGKCLKSQTVLSKDGLLAEPTQSRCSLCERSPKGTSDMIAENLSVSELQEQTEKMVIEDTISNQSWTIKNTENNIFPRNPIRDANIQNNLNKTFATQGSLPEVKKKIWKDKLTILEKNTLTTELLTILDQDLTLKEKAFKPFWTSQSKVISESLWSPIKIDYVDSVLNLSKESLKNTPMGKSWFSIKKKHPQNKNSQMTSFQSLQYSLPE